MPSRSAMSFGRMPSGLPGKQAGDAHEPRRPVALRRFPLDVVQRRPRGEDTARGPARRKVPGPPVRTGHRHRTAPNRPSPHRTDGHLPVGCSVRSGVSRGPMEPIEASLKATYRALLARGLAAGEAANLTAYLHGMPNTGIQWTLREIEAIVVRRMAYAARQRSAGAATAASPGRASGSLNHPRSTALPRGHHGRPRSAQVLISPASEVLLPPLAPLRNGARSPPGAVPILDFGGQSLATIPRCSQPPARSSASSPTSGPTRPRRSAAA